MTHLRRASFVLLQANIMGCAYSNAVLSYCTAPGGNPFAPPVHCDCDSDSDAGPTPADPPPRYYAEKWHKKIAATSRHKNLQFLPRGRWIKLRLYTGANAPIAAFADLSCPNGGGPAVLVPTGRSVQVSQTEYEYSFLALFQAPPSEQDLSVPVCRLEIAWRHHLEGRIHRFSVDVYGINRTISNLPPESVPLPWEYLDTESISLDWIEPPLSPPPPRICPN